MIPPSTALVINQHVTFLQKMNEMCKGTKLLIFIDFGLPLCAWAVYDTSINCMVNAYKK